MSVSNVATAAIETRGLSKYYGAFAAIKEISFSIPCGQVVAFLGPNGAGKSTTMKILTGYMAPSTGQAFILGHNVHEQRLEVAHQIGYLPENGPLYDDMTPISLLRFLGAARGLTMVELTQRIDAVVEQCALQAVIGKPIGKLSKGYRQRVGMAQALLHQPQVLIMDEPTAGLDPNQIHEVRELIRNLGKEKTVLLSTHILQEVEAVAERVLFIHQGLKVFDGLLEDFRKDGVSLDERFRLLTGHDSKRKETLHVS